MSSKNSFEPNVTNPFEEQMQKQFGIQNQSNQNQHQLQSEYAKLWRSPTMKEYLIEQIKDQKLRGEINMEKKITEKMLITEYWKYWFNLDKKEKLKQIYNYPSLKEQDFQQLNRIVEQEKASQFYWASGCTTVSYICYKLFWSKNKGLYNFYRRPAPKIFGRTIFGYKAFKVGFSILSIQAFWIISINYIFNKSIPVTINKEGIYQKYGLEVEERNL